jgi:hypothetical protein
MTHSRLASITLFLSPSSDASKGYRVVHLVILQYSIMFLQDIRGVLINSDNIFLIWSEIAQLVSRQPTDNGRGSISGNRFYLLQSVHTGSGAHPGY